MREVKLIYRFETLRNTKPQQKLTTQRVVLLVVLMLLQQLKLFAEWCLLKHLWSYRSIVVSLRDPTKTTTD